MHPRNVEGLRQSAIQRHQTALQRTDEGIRTLLKEGRAITFQSVHEVAGVSTAWLYRQPDVRRRIMELRDQKRGPDRPAMTTASDPSKTAMLETLKQRVRRLEQENRELRRQIEVLYGQLTQNGPREDLLDHEN